MFLTRKHLSRRTLLRGVGAAVALPLLDAMIPAGTALAQTAAAPKPRLGFFYFPHGAIMDKWTPAATGTQFELPPVLQPLSAHKSQMTIVSNLRNTAAEGAGVHATSPGTWLSCASPFVVNEKDPNYGISADQIAAQRLGQDTPFPSLELCTEEKAASATGVCSARPAAAMAPRYRSARARSRCPWNTIRASCSSACSAKAIRHNSASRTRI